jgi:UDP:flavonoid glycosyltransferase YjiC (YdhE family)
MTRYLFAVFPVSGHVNPGLPIARELVARGHDVRWYSTQRFRRAIEAVGARWVPFRAATAIDEEWLPEQFPGRPSGGIAQLQFDIEHIFVNIVPGALLDIEHELAKEPADVLVSDNAFAVAGLVSERKGTPWAV